MTTRNTLAFLSAGAVLLIAPAGFAEPKPDWTDGSSMEYPNEKYLVGMSSADDLDTAKDRARGEVSKIFRSQLTVKTAVSEAEASRTAAGKTETVSAKSVAESVQNLSQTVLEGLQVVETWHDKANRQYWALAVLERAKTARAYSEKIGEADRLIEQYKAELDGSKEKLEKAKAAMKLLSLFKSRKELNAMLRVADAAGRTIPPKVEEAPIRSAAVKAVAALDVVVDLNGDYAKQIEAGIVSGLGSFGIHATLDPGTDGADIYVLGDLTLAPMATTDRRVRSARATVTVTLKDGKTDKAFLEFSASERSSHLDYPEAIRRALKATSKKISEQVNVAIGDYFENL